MLCGIIVRQLSKTPGSKWKESFIKVNLHPDHHETFDKWVKRIDSQLEGEKFFKESDQLLYRAMPAVWKKMKPTLQREVGTYEKSSGIESVKEPMSMWKRSLAPTKLVTHMITAV